MRWREQLRPLAACIAGATAAYPVLALAFGYVYWPELGWWPRATSFLAWSNPGLDILPLALAGALGALAVRGRRLRPAAAIGAGIGSVAGILLVISWVMAGGYAPDPAYLPLLAPFPVAGAVSAGVARVGEEGRQ